MDPAKRITGLALELTTWKQPQFYPGRTAAKKRKIQIRALYSTIFSRPWKIIAGILAIGLIAFLFWPNNDGKNLQHIAKTPEPTPALANTRLTLSPSLEQPPTSPHTQCQRWKQTLEKEGVIVNLNCQSMTLLPKQTPPYQRQR